MRADLRGGPGGWGAARPAKTRQGSRTEGICTSRICRILIWETKGGGGDETPVSNWVTQRIKGTSWVGKRDWAAEGPRHTQVEV